MTDYHSFKSDLLKYMENHPAPVAPSSQIKRFPDPIGWKTRERFGVTLRYWPNMSELIRMDESTLSGQGIPRMFFQVYLDEIEPKDIYQAQVMNYMNILYTVRSKPLPCLTVLGGNGSGKTFLGCAFVSTVTRLSGCYDRNTGRTDDRSAFFVNEADLFSRIEGYSRAGVDWFRLYSEDADYLVIDEFGMTQWTATDTRRMNQLLNKRFGNGLQTVILTNLDAEKFYSLLSDQLRSRFKTGKSIQMGSPDYRERFTEPEEYDDPF